MLDKTCFIYLIYLIFSNIEKKSLNLLINRNFYKFIILFVLYKLMFHYVICDNFIQNEQ